MSAHPSETYALVLAGGAGTRFWPASRAKRPKQLLPLIGDAPLLTQTVDRVLPLCGDARDGDGDASRAARLSRVLVATGRHLEAATAALLPDLLPRENVLVEPAARNTAPCIGWAAAVVARRDPDAVLMVVPSDHHVRDLPRFHAACARAIESARRGVITTLGVTPTHAETGYGYIEVTRTSGDEARDVVRFVEKPDHARAEQFFAGGKHLWNAGLFFFRAKDLLARIREHMPELAAMLDALDRAAGEGREAEALAELFPSAPNVSIDVAIMEKSPLAVVPASFGWSDVGSFESAWQLAEKDANGNAAPEHALVIDSHDNLVRDLRTGAQGKRVIALVGVEDLVVIETDDALLVAPRARAQDVKLAVDALKQRPGGSDLV